jgi:hypothetical protein
MNSKPLKSAVKLKKIDRLLERENMIVRLAKDGVYVRVPRKRTWFGPYPWRKIIGGAEMVSALELIAERKRNKLIKKATR